MGEVALGRTEAPRDAGQGRKSRAKPRALVASWKTASGLADAERHATERETAIGGGSAATLVTLAAFHAGLSVTLSMPRRSQAGAARLIATLEEQGWVRRATGDGPFALELSGSGEEMAG